jgi:hypothetical protein
MSETVSSSQAVVRLLVCLMTTAHPGVNANCDSNLIMTVATRLQVLNLNFQKYNKNFKKLGDKKLKMFSNFMFEINRQGFLFKI